MLNIVNSNLNSELDGKADADHDHDTADVAGLDAALSGKAAADHTHTLAAIGAAAVDHDHATSDVTGLDAALAGKAAADHTHTASDIGAAAADHDHVTGDVAGLDTALALKASRFIGGLVFFAGPGLIQSGYLYCDGSAVSRANYFALYNVIGTRYGAGDGSTTFNLPDFRGYFLRGDGGENSAAIGTAQGDAIRNITGSICNSDYWTGPNPTATGAFAAANQGSSGWTKTGSYQPGGFDFDASRQVPTAAENRPVNYAVRICIAYC